MNKILIYVDEGVGPRPVRFLLKTLRDENLNQHFQIIRVNRDWISQEDWENETALLIFPGGRDIYYHRTLSGEPNARIRSYVQNGGKYLGLCAGGYYGCASIEFEKGLPLEVIGDRELGFFPGLARGSAYGPNQFNYKNDLGSCVAELEWLGDETELDFSSIYFNGGCEFVNAHSYSNTHVLARYHDIPHKPAAIVQCEVGKGRAILSGVHPEYSASHLESSLTEARHLLARLREKEYSRKKLLHALLQRLLPG
ncbi:MAG: BPL-N domain-containing protein [Waddliaceae bacterium]